ncbi:MAG: hypothetical protein IPM95_07060 [Sphingobacteriales bacterium]|nr:hypothetical protein [Sphingobacteriales bacterium]
MRKNTTVSVSAAKKITAKRSTPKASVKKFVSDFYTKHGKVMTKLAHE